MTEGLTTVGKAVIVLEQITWRLGGVTDSDNLVRTAGRNDRLAIRYGMLAKSISKVTGYLL